LELCTAKTLFGDVLELILFPTVFYERNPFGYRPLKEKRMWGRGKNLIFGVLKGLFYLDSKSD